MKTTDLLPTFLRLWPHFQKGLCRNIQWTGRACRNIQWTGRAFVLYCNATGEIIISERGHADALAFLLEGGEGEEGIECMTGGLTLEGWVRVEGFESNWWRKGGGRRRICLSWMVGEEKATTRGFLKEEYINLGSLKVTVKYLLLHFPSLSNFVLRSANYFSPE